MDNVVFTVRREFAASRALLWRAWSEPDLLAQWYGPGVESVVHQFDLQPGGHWLHEMRTPNGSFFQKMTFQTVDAEQQLIWLHSASDENGVVIPNPMMPQWPLVLLTEVKFAPLAQGCEVIFSQSPHDAGESQCEAFAQTMQGMAQGWEMGFKVIDGLLEALA